MTDTALNEAKGWADALLDREFRGRGDREKSVRHRLAKKIGIPESYLFRLQYKTRDMKEVAGSVYRALMIAYHNACEKNEAAADRYRDERLRLRGPNEAIGEELVASCARMVTASGRDPTISPAE
jgi:hypothetical protein